MSWMALAIWAPAVIGQNTPAVPATRAEQALQRAARPFARRVTALAAQFDPLRLPSPSERAYLEACARDCAGVGASLRRDAEAADARRQQSIAALAARIDREVDAFVATAVTTLDVDPGMVERALRVVLSSASSEQPR